MSWNLKFKSFLLICISAILLIGSCSAEYDVEFEEFNLPSSSARDPKFFKIYSNLKINTPTPSIRCVTPGGECGRCLTRKQCSAAEGGNPTDLKCPDNKGICCLLKLSWNQTEPGIVTVKHNLTRIVTSNNLPSQADFIIPRQKDVCQLRLDFKLFELSPPHSNLTFGNGDCSDDTMTISGADNFNTPLQLCGRIGPTEHLYLHYGASEVISINMDIMNRSSRHDVQITTIRCDSTEKAPDGCSQYYTQQRADVKTFNYPNQHLNNQHYSVCIQATRGSNSITWAKCNDVLEDFFISGGDLGNTLDRCTGDRVSIPGTENGVFCGGTFREVKTVAKPFALYVDFDDLEMTPLPTGPLKPDGCQHPFQCTAGGVPVPATNYTCVNPDPNGPEAECSVEVDHISGIISDRGNTGFCLRFMKT